MTEPAFAPEVDLLRGLASEVLSSLDNYESAKDSSTKASALRSLSQKSQRLGDAANAPADAFSDFTFRPLANACVRVALSMGVFDHLSSEDAPLTVEQIASRTNTELSLAVRIIRGLVAFDIIHQDDDGRYSHTPMSQVYADKSRRSWAVWMWDVMIRASSSMGSYFDKGPLNNPQDPKNAPFQWAHDEMNLDIFEIVKNKGYLPLLNSAMSGSSIICAKQAVASFKFDDLIPGKDGVVLVDVGGAKGDTLREVKRAYPELQGRMILQELQSVLDDEQLSDLGAETRAYNFFEEDQPVKEAAAYYYQRIFHDWDDDSCGKILQSLRPAMGPQSKLLICDVVVPDHRPTPRKVLRDINMLLVGGKERSELQWRTLLENSGFTIARFYGLDNPDNSIIEARVK